MARKASSRAKAPQSSPETDTIKRLLAGTPFLDLFYYFPINIRELRECTHEAPTLGKKPVLSYEKFKERSLAQRARWRSILTNLEKMVGRPFWECEDELMIHADFLHQLPEASVKTTHLDDHLSHFEAFCSAALKGDEAVVASMPTMEVAALLEPILRWSQAHTDSEWSETYVLKIEAIIERAHAGLLLNRANVARRLEFKNTLVFAYIVASSALRVGLSPAVLSRHLFIHRALGVTGWASLEARLRLQYAVLCLHMAQLFFPVERPFELRQGTSSNTMADLHSVLEDAIGASSHQPLLMHHYVFRWFLDKLEAEFFSLQHKKGLRGVPVLTLGEQGAVVDLVRRFTAYRYPVTADHLEAFVLQFGSTSRIRAAIRLLSSIRFYPLWQLAEAVEGILRVESARHGRLVIAPLGDLTGSTSIISYLASHSRLKKLLFFVENVPQALAATRSGGRIYFVDDCILSGTQTLNIVGDLLGTRQLKEHHRRYCQPLQEPLRRKLSQRKVVFVYCVACDYAVERLKRDLVQAGLRQDGYKVLFAALEPLLVKAFGALSPVPWASAEERDDLRRFCAGVGYDLLAERAMRKSWSDKRRRESSLGYSDFQRLMVFPYSVPKSTLTLLWADGGSARRWIPLFPVLD